MPGLPYIYFLTNDILVNQYNKKKTTQFFSKGTICIWKSKIRLYESLLVLCLQACVSFHPIGEISCMKVERSISKWNMNHSCNRKVQWFGQKSELVTQHLDFHASYKTLVNIQHLKQNIFDMILKTFINKNKLLKEW